MPRRAVFLDRDGVINAYAYNPESGTTDSPMNPGEFVLLTGVAEAIAKLRDLGLLVILASNQPGIAKGKLTPSLFEAITRKMTDALEAQGARIDAMHYCMHHPEARLSQYRVQCECRKPKPGLLLEAAKEWDIDLAKSYMVGDGVSDVLAGRTARTTTVFISSRKCYVCDELARHAVQPDYLVGSLPEAADLIGKLEAGEIPFLARFAEEGRCGFPSTSSTYTNQYLSEATKILKQIDQGQVERTVDLLVQLRERDGRLFFLGVGGAAGHASHAVNDFRKIAAIEAYTPTDNVSELTARVNDEGWETAYANWLRGSRLKATDMVFVFSVGGGDLERNISANLVRALQHAKEVGSTICGVVGRNGGFTAHVADACVLVPVVNPATITPHTESLQAVIWHLLVSHPRLKAAEMKWESVCSSVPSVSPFQDNRRGSVPAKVS